jgi:CheY-like chemotaxis protein
VTVDPVGVDPGEPPADPDAAPGREPAVVLLVEDTPSNVRLVERVVARRPGWRLVVAGTGTLGLQQARAAGPRLILLDLHLPDISGEQVVAALRADPSTRDVPVHVVTADAVPGRRARLVALGADGYLTKPVDVQRLLALLDEHDVPARRP